MYQNIIFDLYGTLLDIKTDEEPREFWTYMARFYSYNEASFEAQELKNQYHLLVNQALSEKKKLTDYPDVNILEIFQKLYIQKGVLLKETDAQVILTARVFRNLSTCHIKPYEGVKETLQLLKRKGVKVFLLSNGQRAFTVPELKAFDLYSLFDRVCSSSDVGLCKPDIRFFQHLVNLESLNIKKTLMVGNDHTSDIEGANRLGMDALYLHTASSRRIDPSTVSCRYKVTDGCFLTIQKYLFQND